MVKDALADAFGPVEANCHDALGNAAWRYQLDGGPHPGDKPRPDRPMRAVGPPAWATSVPAQAPARQARARPSRLGATGEAATGPETRRRFTRGILIHRLLELLPPLERDGRAAFARRFLDRQGANLTPARARGADRRRHEGSRPSRSGAALHPGQPRRSATDGRHRIAGETVRIAGQIDRLSVTAEAVFIADYKSDHAPPGTVEGVSKAYLRQLAAYRAALREIYPGRMVRTALVWTAGPTIMEIPPELLDRALA